MRRKQVVLPEPEGPSIAKNSPSAISRVTPSTARTGPKWRQTLTNLTAGDMGSRRRGERPGSSEPGRPMLEASLPEDGNVILCPSRVGHASALLFAFGGRRAPEPDLVEILETIGGAAGVGQKLVAFASCGHRRHRPEPGGKVTLQLGVQRMLEPLIGAVGVLGLGMHHCRVGPARCPLLGNGRGDGFLVGLQEIDLIRPRRGSDDAFILEVIDL